MAIVYLITNRLNGKQYVGKTVQSLEARWYGHVGSARRSDNGMMICRAIRKHGVEAFKYEILEECDENTFSQREMHWISEFKTHVSCGGYNLTWGGDGGLLGYEFSKESKEKIRQKAIGRKHTNEARLKMSIAAKARVHSREAIEARAKSNRGKRRSEEQRRNISESLKGRLVSEETRKKISEANRKRVTSEVTKEKLRKQSSGRSHSLDVRRRISEARSKAVEQCDLNGNVLNVYPSVKKASEATGVGNCTIFRALSARRSAKGYLWRYHCPLTTKSV